MPWYHVVAELTDFRFQYGVGLLASHGKVNFTNLIILYGHELLIELVSKLCFAVEGAWLPVVSGVDELTQSASMHFFIFAVGSVLNRKGM